MSTIQVTQTATADESSILVAARRAVTDALYDLELAWRNPRPDAVVAAARRQLAAAESWADARREGA
ncbi:hypothetical protein GCM10027404_24250 [Arthrobacter tumbae]|uniref:hypothetical protein n=1 Tax=Arthrobacter tumbae TaxID=163874 RepID=UPI00195DC420|nr:hypothetical protein [Arthrobacter tumbae]MBM7781450.1 hypothetical protein [Arthrobacter tumbae]